MAAMKPEDQVQQCVERYTSDLDRLAMPRRTATGAGAADVDHSSARLLLERAIREAWTAGAVFGQAIGSPSRVFAPGIFAFASSPSIPEGGAKSCGGAGIPCPSFDEVDLGMVEVCNCHERFQAWGNPYGDETCPVHGELVKASIRAGRMVSLRELDRP